MENKSDLQDWESDAEQEQNGKGLKKTQGE